MHLGYCVDMIIDNMILHDIIYLTITVCTVHVHSGIPAMSI
jgi:hypothetical protein